MFGRSAVGRAITARHVSARRWSSARIAITLLSNGTLKTYPDLSHGLFATHPDLINADLLSFIES